ncbi:MAG: hypothetical protein IT381_05085 [Deltaproteobacteria bacterium]|nr:hypothetical protein [Deltaproteobacteria bacterium]
MRLVAIDPDTKKLGYAHFFVASLRYAGAHDIDNVLARLKAHKPHLVLCEMPQQYGRKGDQRDFLALARVVGRIEQTCADLNLRFEAVKPAQWKGTTPKAVCTLRAWEALEPRESWGVHAPRTALAKLERGQGLTSGEGSDVLDAIGIGLWKLGRLHKKLF